MDLSPELVVALLAHLPEGVLLLDLGTEPPSVLHANGEAGAGGVVGPMPLGELVLHGSDDEGMPALLARLHAGDKVMVEIERGGRRTPLELLPLPQRPGESRRYIGLEPAATARVVPTPGAGSAIQRDDRLTGLAHRDWFWELYRRDFAIAAREHRSLSVLVADIDSLELYNTTFDRAAGDSLIRLVGRALAAGLRRSGDLVAPEGAGRYLALTLGQTAEQSRRHASDLTGRVRELYLHHPRSKVARFATVSIGVAHWDGQTSPAASLTPEAIYASALTALAESRRSGRNRATLTTLASS